MSRLPLEGIKVADFSWQYTGPIVTKFLADFGAEVIKIEARDRPDGARGYSPYKEGKPGINRSMVFANYNSDKYDMTINLRKPKGLELARDVIRRSNIVIECFRPGVAKRLGIGYEEVKEIKPDIVYVSMSFQGQTGRLAKQYTLGAFFQAAVGVTHLTGWPDRKPTGTPVAYPDYISPWYLLVGIMAALDYQRRTGKGQYLDISQLETSLQYMIPSLLDYSVNNRNQGRIGNRSSYSAPHGVLRCQGDDRWCAVAAFNDEEWRAMCQVMGRPTWSYDVKFTTFSGRKENEDELEKLVEAWTIEHGAEDVMQLMQDAKVTAGVVQTGQDIVDRDKQLKHRHHFRMLEHPEIGEHYSECCPARLSKTPAQIITPAPCLGEHNEYVCTEILGYPSDKFMELVIDGVFD